MTADDSAGFTERERRSITGRARTLHERLGGPPNDRAESADHRPDTEELLSEWADSVAVGVSLPDRLADLGTSRSAVEGPLANTLWPADRPLPDWLDTLSSLAATLDGASPAEVGDTQTEPETETDTDTEVPFVEFLDSLVAFGFESLPEGHTPETDPELADWLRSRLRRLLERPSYVEFRSFVAHHDETLASTDPAAVDDPPTELYETFVDRLHGDAFRRLCLEYPVLARLLATVLDQFESSVRELLARIDADWAALAETFGVDGAVTGLVPTADDTHAGGRVPVRVVFEDGSVVYKPRPTTPVAGLFEVLDWVTETATTDPQATATLPSFDTPAVLSRGAYGWMEYVEPEPLPDREAAADYYRRAGVLLCVAAALGLTDCHAENLIAAGATPTVVDAETVLGPSVDGDDQPFDVRSDATVGSSVLATGLLPVTGLDPRGSDPAFAGFTEGLGSGDAAAVPSLPRRVVRAPNTDVMRATSEPVRVAYDQNTPEIDDDPVPPGDHVDEIVAGFEAASRRLATLDPETVVEALTPGGDAGSPTAGGEAASDADGATARTDGDDATTAADDATTAASEDTVPAGRVVYRPTQFYGGLLRSSVGIGPLSDGLRLGIEWESLVRPFDAGHVDTADYRRLCAAERTALARFDVPRVVARPDETQLTFDGAPTGVDAATTAVGRVSERLEALSATRRARQTTLIRLGLSDDPSPSPPPAGTDAPRTDERALAVETFDRIRDTHATDGDWRWTTLSAAGRGVGAETVDETPYHGWSGVALAAAALFAVTGDPQYRTDARELLGPVVDTVRERPATLSLGGARGVGGVVYALSVCGDLLDDRSLHRAADDAVRGVPEGRPAAATSPDVFDGCAGTVLGLLAHHRRGGDDEARRLAVACGDRLLSLADRVGGGLAWQHTADDSSPTGFAHGSSGAALALGRLATVTDAPRFAEAARAAVAFEATQYDPERRNWATTHDGDTYRDRWCHGRAGIALARDRLRSLLDSSPGTADLTRVFEGLATADPAPVDQLCCGTLGRVDALVSRRAADHPASDRSATAGVSTAAVDDLIDAVTARRRRDGQFALQGHDPPVLDPTLFDGLAGVSYVLARRERPDLVPCVLGFD